MRPEKPVHIIVIDTAPVVRNEPSVDSLLASCETVVTVPSVLGEIRDQQARARVETLLKPFLTLRSPKPKSIQFVIDFAKKSGDFSVLSRTDLELIALTYEIECEHNGDSKLRKFPGDKEPKPSIVKEIGQPSKEAPDGLADLLLANVRPSLDCDSLDIQTHVESQDMQNTTDATKPVDVSNTPDQAELPQEALVEISKDNPVERASLERKESDSEASDGWITPSNLKRHQAKPLNGSTAPISKDSQLQVGCMTSDYAMQNVLLQIGLNLLSPSFHRIRNIRTYILRCHACFHLVKDQDTTKQFCPRCGKPTLTRVSCSTDQKGDFRIHLKKNMQWNHRGDRYSIPKPVSGSANGKVGQGKGGGKGGWGRELILAEDQKEYQRAVSDRGGVKATDLMDEDYLPSILTGDRGRTGGRPKIGAGRNVNAKKRAK